jgi:hypothetical protein
MARAQYFEDYNDYCSLRKGSSGYRGCYVTNSYMKSHQSLQDYQSYKDLK